MSLRLLLIVGLVLAALRLYMILAKRVPSKRRVSTSTCKVKVAIFLGSGGHTSEALTLMSALDFRRYNHRIYIFSEGDNLSAQKALALESKREHEGGELNCTIFKIPRARKVHQSVITTPFSAAWSLTHCIYRLTVLPLLTSQFRSPSFADVLILNGPGTCFVLCLAVYLNRFLGLPSPIVIYVETFARVKSLSLSGKLIRPFADRFVTQWPSMQSNSLSSQGWLV